MKPIGMDNRNPQEMINHLNDHTHKQKKPEVPETTDKKWATFTSFNPKVRKIT